MNERRQRWAGLAGLTAVGLIATFVAQPAHAEQLPPSTQALLLLRTLAYDRNLKARVGGAEVVVAVVFRAGHRASEDLRSGMAEALNEAGQKLSLAGLPMKVAEVQFDARTLGKRLSDVHAGAVYVCVGLGDDLAVVTAATRRLKIVSATGSEAEVRQGISLGFVPRSDKAGILVNLANVRAEGADLDSALLRVAEVVR